MVVVVVCIENEETMSKAQNVGGFRVGLVFFSTVRSKRSKYERTGIGIYTYLYSARENKTSDGYSQVLFI